MLTATIWDQVLSRIEGHVGKHSFSTWFKPTSLLTDAGNSLSIRVPNLLFVEWLPKHYSVVLAEALREVGRADVKLVFVPDAAGTAAEEKRATSRSGLQSMPSQRGRAFDGAGDRHGRPDGTSTARRQPHSPLHFRQLHRRTVEPVCARRLSRGCRDAVALLQPVVHPRRRRTRQDPPDARHRPLRACSIILAYRCSTSRPSAS